MNNFSKKRMDEVAVLKSGTTFLKEQELEEGELLYCKISDMNLEGNEKYINKAITVVNTDISSVSNSFISVEDTSDFITGRRILNRTGKNGQ